jgi:hypothetical protein
MIENSGEAELMVTAADGTLIERNDMDGKHALDISTYPGGIYLLYFRSGDEVQVRKVVKY